MSKANDVKKPELIKPKKSKDHVRSIFAAGFIFLAGVFLGYYLGQPELVKKAITFKKSKPGTIKTEISKLPALGPEVMAPVKSGNIMADSIQSELFREPQFFRSRNAIKDVRVSSYLKDKNTDTKVKTALSLAVNISDSGVYYLEADIITNSKKVIIQFGLYDLASGNKLAEQSVELSAEALQ